MGFWKVVELSRLLNREPSWTITSLKILESVDRDSRSSSGELQKSRLLFAVPTADCLPEELDNLIRLSISSVVGVLLPILNINFGNTADQQLQLSLVKDVDKLGRDQLVETCDEGLELLINTLLDSPLDHEVDVFLLVLVGNLDITSAWLEVLHISHSESLIFGGEGLLQNTLDRVIEHPLKTAVEVGIDSLHIGQCNGLVKHHLVQCTNEECIKETTMENSKTDYTANEFEVIEMLWVDSRVGVDLESVVVVGGVLEQTVEGVEHFVRQEEEEFSGQSTIIETVFSVELDH